MTLGTGRAQLKRPLWTSVLLCCGLGSVVVFAAAAPDSARIEGAVRVRSDLPEPSQGVANGFDPEVCGDPVAVEDLVVSSEGGVAHAIVWLTRADGEPLAPSGASTPASERDRFTLDNRDCQFAPRSLALQAGDTLVMENSDPTLHTVHWYGPEVGNLAMPFEGQTRERPFPEPGLYEVRCDVHPWMRAYLRVGSHRHQSVTDPSGAFDLDAVPPGRYRLVAWHERLGRTHTEFSIAGGEHLVLELAYSPTLGPEDSR